MKIGIITFWESMDNYGQVLQAYALQQILIQMGHQPYQIKFSMHGAQQIPNKISFLRKIWKVLSIYPVIRKYKHYKENKENLKFSVEIETKNKQREFSDFRKIYIQAFPQEYRTIDEIRRNPPIADCYITGSDQVWRMLLDCENNKVYFLDFGKDSVKRISYAASFSRYNYPSQYKNILKEQLSHFDAISVRENEGLEICSDAGFNAVKVLDPTLLLEKDRYLSLAKDVEHLLNRYIFIYSINIQSKDEICWDDIVRYAKQNQLNLITTPSSGNISGREILEQTIYEYATIPQWLSYVNHASVVVTTSFHGVVFCLIMQTNFIYFPLEGKRAQGNGRVCTLLQSLHLENKIYGKDKRIEDIIQDKIDWKSVEDLLREQKVKSIDFLNNALSL